MRLLKKSVIVGAATAALTVGVATTQAHASIGPAISSKNSCGYAQFEDAGDLFYIHDTCSDGRAVRVYWDMGADGVGWSYYDYRGGYTGWAKSYKLDLELTENRWMNVQVCLSDNAVFVNGSCGSVRLEYTS
ncbi:hypothetical protein [Yinghuangia soli]|uniref:Secreted protein n=1 Tax=Yinghuangia soli TaxID=2908204 RepID=A0AA41Q1C5_9ACTN|nr:hypothetical protein [Yinghuangia soli]MCF2529698.1 hypothetical protein [Yinghuangia soli]